jgi:hypothetical protein
MARGLGSSDRRESPMGAALPYDAAPTKAPAGSEPLADAETAEERPTDEQLRHLVSELRDANDERHASEPSTPEYHSASRRVESIAHEVWRTAIVDELDAQEHAELD